MINTLLLIIIAIILYIIYMDGKQVDEEIIYIEPDDRWNKPLGKLGDIPLIDQTKEF